MNQVCLQAAISITLKLTSATNSCTCHDDGGDDDDDDGDDDHLLDNMDREYILIVNPRGTFGFWALSVCHTHRIPTN